jgi:hypothetical protein
VNVDFEFPYTPCDIITLDVEDELGKKIDDYYGNLMKTRLSSKGKNLGE